MSSRYFESEIGRFINVDGLVGPVGGILTHNMYAYGLNNPIMNVDPNGDFALSLSFGDAAITSIAPFILPAFTVVATVALVAYVVVKHIYV